jgi:hypothetical protein
VTAKRRPGRANAGRGCLVGERPVLHSSQVAISSVGAAALERDDGGRDQPAEHGARSAEARDGRACGRPAGALRSSELRGEVYRVRKDPGLASVKT